MNQTMTSNPILKQRTTKTRPCVFRHRPYLKFFELYNKTVTVQQMIDVVCTYYGFTFEDISIKDNSRNKCLPRFVLFSIMYANGFSMKEIGNLFNKRDHSTIYHGVATLQDLIHTDHTIAFGCDEIMDKLYNKVVSMDEVRSLANEVIKTVAKDTHLYHKAAEILKMLT